MKYTKISDTEKRLLALVDPSNAVGVVHNTARAIVEPVGTEIRIPYVSRDERGDFAELMDRLVDEVGYNRVRFVSIKKPDEPELTDLVDRLGPDDARNIEEAVHGFEEEPIHDYQHVVQTLVGDWEPDEYE